MGKFNDVGYKKKFQDFLNDDNKYNNELLINNVAYNNRNQKSNDLIAADNANLSEINRRTELIQNDNSTPFVKGYTEQSAVQPILAVTPRFSNTPAPKFVEDNYENYNPKTTSVNPLREQAVSNIKKRIVPIQKTISSSPYGEYSIQGEKIPLKRRTQKTNVHNIMDLDTGSDGYGIEW